MRQTDVTVLVELRLLPEFIEQGKRDLMNFARTVRNSEPECSSIEIAQDLDDPTKITMIEKWSDRKAYEGPHLQTRHMKSFVEQSSRYFDGSATISFCRATTIDGDDLWHLPPYGR